MTQTRDDRGHSFPKCARLTERREFLQVQGTGFRHHADFGIVAIRSRGEQGSASSSDDGEMLPDGSRRPTRRSDRGPSRAVGYDGARLGITVTKKVGNSPARNRWKRVVREAFRQAPHRWSPYGAVDIVVIARPGQPVPTVARVQAVLAAALARWGRRGRGRR